MKAIVATGYGGPEVLELREVDRPTPQDNEVLIRVHATTVVSGDVRIRSSTYSWPGVGLLMRIMLGIGRPRKAIPGNEFAGEIESVGKAVTRFGVGDQVFGVAWGIAFAGANAEYLCMPEDGMMLTLPASMAYVEAAALPVGGLAALHFLRRGGIRRGQKILIVGGSGSVGTFAVQLARYYGAEVTAVCSTKSEELVRSLGADHVIDYTKEDFTTSGETYDIVFDAAIKTSFPQAKGSLKKGGVYLTLDWPLHQALWTSIVGDKKVVIGMARKNVEDLVYLKDLVEAGELRPVIDRRYPLEETAEAHRYAERGHKQGNLVITVGAG